MSKVPTPTPNEFLSGSDLTDEIRRHLRTLSLITRKGEGTMVFMGRQVQVTDLDREALSSDLKKAMEELKSVADYVASPKQADR